MPALEARYRASIKAIESRDVEKFLEFYTDDAVVMTPTGLPMLAKSGGGNLTHYDKSLCGWESGQETSIVNNHSNIVTDKSDFSCKIKISHL